jgi:hypothetical protein
MSRPPLCFDFYTPRTKALLSAQPFQDKHSTTPRRYILRLGILLAPRTQRARSSPASPNQSLHSPRSDVEILSRLRSVTSSPPLPSLKLDTLPRTANPAQCSSSSADTAVSHPPLATRYKTLPINVQQPQPHLPCLWLSTILVRACTVDIRAEPGQASLHSTPGRNRISDGYRHRRYGTDGMFGGIRWMTNPWMRRVCV